MEQTAKVGSIEALRLFKAALWKFQENVNIALTEADAEARQALVWLETEGLNYWQGQVRKRQEAVGKAKEAVRQKKLFKDFSGNTPSAVDEEKALAVAQRELEQAEQKLANVRKYTPRLQKELGQYRAGTQRLATTVSSDIPAAAARLENWAAALEAYVSAIPTAPGELVDAGALAGASSLEGETDRSMARAVDEPAQGFQKSPANAPPEPSPFEALGKLPEMHPPQVAMLQLDTTRGRVLTEDGGDAGPGEGAVVYPTFEAAQALAMARIEQRPGLECHIYNHTGELMTIVRKLRPGEME